jgi:hypothetical protein
MLPHLTHFPAKVRSAVNLFEFSVNGKVYLTTRGPVRPFVSDRTCGYKLGTGPTYFGRNFGAGVLKELNAHGGLQGPYNFHMVNTPTAATKVPSQEIGIRFAF